MKHLQALILAAGSSRRFPSNKLLQPRPDQRCLLDISYELARRLTPQVVLVINNNPQLQEHCHQQQYPFLINAHAETGMASSIACGVEASADADGWAIFLADMPCIKPSTVQLLAENWSAHAVTLPTYRQQSGHPVIFSKHWYARLCALTGDQGARKLLRDNPHVFHVETDDAGVCLDIDTEADWETYLESGCT
jgi:molybdenum cofactor cytidylyltransferase